MEEKSMKIWFNLMVGECFLFIHMFFHGVHRKKADYKGWVGESRTLKQIPLPQVVILDIHLQISRLYLFVFVFLGWPCCQVLSISFQKGGEKYGELIEAVLIQLWIAWWFGKFEGYNSMCFRNHVSRKPIFSSF